MEHIKAGALRNFEKPEKMAKKLPNLRSIQLYHLCFLAKVENPKYNWFWNWTITKHNASFSERFCITQNNDEKKKPLMEQDFLCLALYSRTKYEKIMYYLTKPQYNINGKESLVERFLECCCYPERRKKMVDFWKSYTSFPFLVHDGSKFVMLWTAKFSKFLKSAIIIIITLSKLVGGNCFLQ